MNVLSVRGLCKRYGSFALRDVSFDVAPGSITGFIGRNGAGKTTTLKSLLDFVHPDAGEALFFGRPLSADEFGVKQAVGFASGGFGFYPLKPAHCNGCNAPLLSELGRDSLPPVSRAVRAG